jgi:hypothetical protein
MVSALGAVLPDPWKPSLPLQPKMTAILAPFTATFPLFKNSLLIYHQNQSVAHTYFV